jgi:hypothetical protein
MSLNLTQYPSGYCYLNKVTEFVMTANYSVTMSLIIDPNGSPEEIFTSRYHPNLNGVIITDLTDIVKDYVKSTVPMDGNDFVQADFIKEFQFKIEEDYGGQQTGNFTVVNIAVNTTETVESWCASNFLTHQAAQKRTNYESPEWLTWLDLDGDYSLKVRFYKKSGGNVEATVKTDSADGCYTVNVGYSRLIRMVNMLPSQFKGYYDLVLCDGSDEEIAYQRYLYHERSGKEHYYLFVNPQGGIDTIIADGANVLNPDMTLNYGRFHFQYTPIDDADNIRMWNQAFSIEWKERYWVHGLMATRGEAAVYFVGAKAYEKIVVVGTSFSMSDNGQLAPTSFDYILSEATQVMLASEERSRGFTQSAADATEELHDETTKVFVAFSQGATEPVVIPSALLYVLFEIGDSEKTEPVYYFVDGNEEGYFTPGEDESPVQLSIKAGGSVHFETEGSLASLELRYYPTNIV